MSIRINTDKCIGCGKCCAVCPGTLLELNSVKRKAEMLYPRDCWGCVSCVKECPKGAIEFFLGADIGGRGSILTVKEEKNIVHWNIHKYDGTDVVIDINRNDANKY